jgi:hypothetical protein
LEPQGRQDGVIANRGGKVETPGLGVRGIRLAYKKLELLVGAPLLSAGLEMQSLSSSERLRLGWAPSDSFL